MIPQKTKTQLREELAEAKAKIEEEVAEVLRVAEKARDSERKLKRAADGTLRV